MPARILITGGAGFMGSNAVRHFLSAYPKAKVVNLDKLTYAGNLENLRDVERNPRYTFVHGDITDAALVDRLFREHRFDAVINYAAETHVDRSILEPGTFILTDVVGTYRLLEAARQHGIERYIQISTDEVFGSIDAGEFREDSPFDPSSPYSASKAGADHLVRAYAKTYGLPTIVTHSCNFYGPFHYPEKLIPLFITNLLEGKTVPVYGDGRQVREWIYTEDHCAAVQTILERGKPGDVYNIGTGERVENIETTRRILSAMGLGEDRIEHVTDRPAHDVRYALDATKLRNKLSWQPRVGFDEGLARTVAWYREHEDWWRPIKSGAYLEYYEAQYGSR